MPRKGKFARCVESVSERGGVTDPRAVCAASIARKRGRTRGRVNARSRGAKREKALYGVAKQLALAGAGPAALLMGNPDLQYYAKQSASGEWEIIDRSTGTVVDHAKHKGAARNKLVYWSGKRSRAGWQARNPAKRKNAGARTAEEAFEDFHGHAPEETITFDSVHHFPGKTAAIGDLVELDIRVPAGRGLRNRFVHLSDFGEAWLTRHPRMKQLYVEGGDQSLDLNVFGLDDKDPHETEYLGELVRCVYFTRKDHLGAEGGEANYHHKFGKNELTLKKTELIKVGYHVPDEQLIFMGGGYEIPAEGIDG